MTNCSIVQKMFNAFNDGESLADRLTADVVLEFPYGPTLQIPSRIDGRATVAAHLHHVWMTGLRLRDVVVTDLSDGRILAEYIGVYHTIHDMHLPIPLVSILELEGGKIRSMREYWDTKALSDANHAALPQ